MPSLPPRRIASPWLRRILLFVSCALLLDALFGDRGLAETMKARHGLRRLSADVEHLKHDNLVLREQVRGLRADPSAIEAVARRRLGLIRRGEILVIVRDRP